MKKAAAILCSVVGATIAQASDEPPGWQHCLALDAALGPAPCVEHVLAGCDASADRQLCLTRVTEAWYAHDANLSLAAASRVSLKELADEAERLGAIHDGCSTADMVCVLGNVIPGALAAHRSRGGN